MGKPYAARCLVAGVRFESAFLCAFLLVARSVAYPLVSGALSVGFGHSGLCVLESGTVANTLLLREYQLAETCFVAWTCFTALLFRRLQSGTSLVRPSLMLSGALLATAVCSTGYFNALYPVLTLLCIVLYAWRVRAFRNWPFFVGIALLCPLFCYLAYQ